MQTMASPISICSPSSFGNASRSTQLSFQIQLGFQASISSKLPQWSTLSNPYSSAFFLNLGNAFKSTQLNSLPQWATPSNPNLNQTSKSNAQYLNSATFLNSIRLLVYFSNALSKSGQHLQIHAAWLSNSQVRAISISNRPLNSIHSAFKCNLNSASKCNLNLAIKFQIQCHSLFGLVSQIHSAFKCNFNSASKCNLNSAFKCNLNSQLCNVYFFSQNRRIIPQRNFLLESSQPFKSALAIGKSAYYSAQLQSAELLSLIPGNLAISPRCL